MNFGNDFSNNLTGWQGVVGTAPGALGLATDVVNLAPPVVKSKVTSGFVVTPAGVSGKNGTTTTLFLADLLLQGTALYVVARFSPTAYIGVKLESTRICSVVEYHTGAEHLLASVDLTPMLPPATEAPLEVRISFYGTNVVAVVNSTPVIEVACTVITDGLAGFGFIGTPLGTEIADRCSGALDILDNSGTTRIDCEYDVLAAAGYPGTIPDKELEWLKASGATGATLLDCWATFLDAQGIPPGDTMDRRYIWLLGLIGVTDAIGDSWLDLWKAFWCEFSGDIGGGGGGTALSKDPFFTTPIDAVWTPIVPAHASYSNDFSGTGGNDLTGWEASTGEAPISFGPIGTRWVLDTNSLAINQPGSTAVAPGFSGVDVEVEVTALATYGSGYNTGPIARANGTDAIFFALSGTTLTLFDYRGGSGGWNAALGTGIYADGAPAVMKLRVMGNQVSGYVNGVLLVQGTTQVLGGGKVGVRGNINNSPFRLFQSFTATSLDPFYTYDTADFTAFVTDVGLSQASAKALPTGTAGTFHVRLREAHATDTIVTIRNGTTLLGNVTITAGQVYRQVRYILSAPVSKDFSFVLMSPVTGMLYTNDFSGTGGNDLTGWEFTPGYAPGALVPLTDQFALTSGNLVAGTAVSGSAFPLVAAVEDVEASISIPAGFDRNTSQVGISLRATATQSILVRINGVYLDGYQQPGGATLFSVDTSPVVFPATLSASVKGGTVTGSLGSVKGSGTTGNLGVGRVGVYGYALPPGGGIAESFRASSGGVAFESFSAGVTAADGGIPQTLDPYFNDSTKWVTNSPPVSNYIANGVCTFVSTTSYLAIKQALTGLVAGDVVEVRVYCASLAAGDNIGIRADEGTLFGQITQGWNAVQVTLGPNREVTLMRNGTSGLGDSKFHFFFAWKATPVVLYTP